MSIFGAIAQLGGQLISNAGSARQNRKNREAQAEENAKAREWERQQWYDRTNYEREYQEKYNSPAAQMQRLKDAGINPHLAYQNGSPMNTSNASIGGGSPNSGTSALPPGQNSMNFDFGDIMLKMAQKRNIDADTKLKETTADGNKIINGINKVDLENKVNLVNQENAQRDLNIKATKAGIDLSAETLKKTTQEITNLVSQDVKLQTEIETLITKKNLDQAKIVETYAIISNLKATYDQINAQTKNIEANTRLTNEKSKTESVTRSYLSELTKKVGEEFKALTRGNQVGNKFDMSNADAQYRFNEANAKRAFEMVKNSELGNKMQQLQITEQEMINILRGFDVAERPLETVDKVKNTINPFKSSKTTSTRFDSKGNYQGHTTTRTRSRR